MTWTKTTALVAILGFVVGLTAVGGERIGAIGLVIGFVLACAVMRA
ncbi:hypothetical protein [Alloactinosynnema sp. L-07]|nr:hypothetical protein [Alloactinosynnema sp. L-07]CRK59054.1 hypothetical protein [Alloactinosynnema sp. L-07]